MQEAAPRLGDAQTQTARQLRPDTGPLTAASSLSSLSPSPMESATQTPSHATAAKPPLATPSAPENDLAYNPLFDAPSSQQRQSQRGRSSRSASPPAVPGAHNASNPGPPPTLQSADAATNVNLEALQDANASLTRSVNAFRRDDASESAAAEAANSDVAAPLQQRIDSAMRRQRDLCAAVEVLADEARRREGETAAKVPPFDILRSRSGDGPASIDAPSEPPSPSVSGMATLRNAVSQLLEGHEKQVAAIERYLAWAGANDKDAAALAPLRQRLQDMAAHGRTAREETRRLGEVSSQQELEVAIQWQEKQKVQQEANDRRAAAEQVRGGACAPPQAALAVPAAVCAVAPTFPACEGQGNRGRMVKLEAAAVRVQELAMHQQEAEMLRAQLDSAAEASAALAARVEELEGELQSAVGRIGELLEGQGPGDGAVESAGDGGTALQIVVDTQRSAEADGEADKPDASTAQRELREARAALQEAEARAEEAETRADAAARTSHAAAETVASLKAGVEQAREDAAAQEAQLAALHAQVDSLEADCAAANAAADALRGQLATVQDEADTLRRDAQEGAARSEGALDEEKAALQAALQDADARAVALREQLQERTKAADAAAEAARALGAELQAARRVAEAAERANGELESRLGDEAAAEEQMRALKEQLRAAMDDATAAGTRADEAEKAAAAAQADAAAAVKRGTAELQQALRNVQAQLKVRRASRHSNSKILSLSSPAKPIAFNID